MSLENATNVAELVPTNPAGTDPVSDGDAHLRMIKTVMQNNAIKQMNGLHPAAAENHFWDASVANELTLKRGTPDVPGVELINALNGVLSFPNQGQSLTPNGYVKLPGGLVVQWGQAVTSATNDTVFQFPVLFPIGVFCILGSASDTNF